MKILLFFALLHTAAAHASGGIPGYPEQIHAYDSREVAMLPAYCKHTQLFRDRVAGGNDKAQIERWRAMMGPTFQAMHHYCWALMSTNRAIYLTASKQLRSFYLQASIKDIDYVVERAPSSFVLLPEILTKKGENLIRLGQGPVGVHELERAIELKSDYWPPYASLSDYYRDIGNRSKAREVLEKGLASSPGSAALQTRLANLKQEKARAR
jgi:tetratricopeptide (TPR) repeat protein